MLRFSRSRQSNSVADDPAAGTLFQLRDSASVELPDGSTSRIESLACDGMSANAAVLDLATLEVTKLSV